MGTFVADSSVRPLGARPRPDEERETLEASPALPTVLFLPGTGGSVERDFATVRYLLPDDMPVDGYDYSPDRGATFETMVDEVVSHIDASESEAFLVVGYSLSAAIAVGVAVAKPDRVAGIVLIAGFSRGKDARVINEFRGWQHLLELGPDRFAHHVARLGHRQEIADSMTDEEVEQLVEEHLRSGDFTQTSAQIAIDLEIDLGELSPEVKQPTFVIGCTEDRIVPEAVTKELAYEIPGSHYIAVKAGHYIPNEAPHQVARLITTWWHDISDHAKRPCHEGKRQLNRTDPSEAPGAPVDRGSEQQ